MTGTSVLRVLNGRLAGTDKPLPANGTVSIGHQFWQHVVLRDPATKGIAVDLAVEGGTTAQITVLSGEAQLLGSRLEAGQTAILPAYVPFSIGGIALAWGDPAGERWSEAGSLVTVEPHPLNAPPSAADQALALAARARAGTGDLFREAFARPFTLTAVVAVIAVIVLVGAMPNAVASLGLFGSPVTRADQALVGVGLPMLSAAADPADDQAVIVSGVVAADADRTKAQDALRRAGIDGNLQVQTSAELAAATADVARIHNIRAVATSIGRTGVQLRTVPLADDQRAALIQAGRTDVRRVGRLVLRSDLPPDDEPPIRTIADATKKVSTVVAGDPAYIQTVDGARYFTGAILPSGHRLVAIQGNTVILDKSGRETRLTF